MTTTSQTMDAPCRQPASVPPPPALIAVRERFRVADLGAGRGGAAFLGPPDTPPRVSLVTVPFLWEEAPGKPKAAAAPSPTAAITPAVATNAGPFPEGDGGDRQDSAHADQARAARRPLPLKLPPRLQQVPASSSASASFAAADTPPLKLPPRLQQVPAASSSSSFAAADTLPLKLPPRLQQVPASTSSSLSFAAADTPPLSPKTVLLGPYITCTGGGGGGRRSKLPRWARSSSAAALRRTPSAGGAGFFSRTWSNKPKAAAAAAAPGGSNTSKNRGGGDRERDAAGPADGAPWCSPASSSSTTSSSSVSTCFGADEHGRGRLADWREVSSEVDDGSPRVSVRITRFRRNRSLPAMTTSNLWASIRRRVKHITPWS